jgi:hypothetical protein
LILFFDTSDKNCFLRRSSLSQDKALIPVEQRTVDFYGDELTAVLVEGEPYVPLAPICNYLGVSWPGQFERIQRDTVLSEAASTIRVTRMEGDREVARELVCLPLKYINGWLFGINANRVKEELKEKIVQYQRECYEVLARAFQPPTVSPTGSLAHIREMALAIANMAEQQMLLESRASITEARLEKASEVVGDIRKRLSRVESRVWPGNYITDEQAAEISLRVKALASLLQEQGPGQNTYQSVFSELYRRYGVSSYKAIRLEQYQPVLAFLEEWRQTAVSSQAAKGK